MLMSAITKTRTSRPFRKGPVTFEEFVDLVPDGAKADLLDGVIYMASPDNTDAGALTTWLAIVLGGFVDYYDLGKLYLLRVCYRIGPKRGPEPDLGYVPKALEARRRRGYIDGPPALAIEIVSPDSVERDYVLKRAMYEKAGVREYWIIDPDERRVTFLGLHGKRFRKSLPLKHVFASQALPGFHVDERWLRGTSRPRAYDVLRELIAQE
jgi:Uma2 family endonuclease